MVLADSHRIPRAPCYNGRTPYTHTTRFRLQGSHPLRPAIPDGSATQPHTRPTPAEMRTDAPQQPRRRSPCRVTTRQRFSHHPLSLATTHGISSPTGTEMFHFPASPLAPYTTSDTSDTPQRVPGLPIRTPSDHSPSAGSPRLIAGHHVLHRPLMPRHPPNAQKNNTQNPNKKPQQTNSTKTITSRHTQHTQQPS